MQGLQLLESAIRNMDGAAKPDPGSPDAPESRAFLEALLETDALKDSGLTLEDLEAWLASQGGKGMPLGGQELPLGDMGDGNGAQGELAQAQQLLQRADAAAERDGRDAGNDGARADHALLREMLGMNTGQGRGAAGSTTGNPLAGGAGGEQGDARLLDLAARARELQPSVGDIARDRGQATADSEARSQSEGSRGLPAGFQQTLQSAMPQQTTGTPSYSISQPMDQSGWGQALGERVMMMANQGVQHARVQVNPPELGPLDVRIRSGDDKTSVVFQAQSAVTREALDAELPRLRAMLADNGVENAEVSVDHDDTHPESEFGESREGLNRGGDGETDGEDDASDGDSGSGGGVARGLVDRYA